MIFTDFFKALGQLPDGRFQRVLWLGLGLTIALLILIYAVLLGLINGFMADSVTLPIIGEVTWLGEFLSWGSFALVFFSSFFLMVPVASAITSLFLEDVAAAVEEKHYAHLPAVSNSTFSEGLKDTVNFMGILVAANLLAIFIYVLIPPAAIFIFYALNGFLLGREYFQVSAMRRLGRAGAKDLWRKNIPAVWAAGCLMAVPLSVPLVNLVIPILGAATFTHLFHRLAAK